MVDGCVGRLAAVPLGPAFEGLFMGCAIWERCCEGNSYRTQCRVYMKGSGRRSSNIPNIEQSRPAQWEFVCRGWWTG